MKKILIALDYNESAQQVAEIGYKLARTMKAEAVLFHALTETANYSAFQYGPVMGFPGYIDPDFRAIKDITELKNKSLSYLDQIKKHLGDNKIKMEVAEGKTAETILYAANEMKVDIIVMGSHSKRWLEKILVGSVTEEVLRDSTIPMFIIPVREK